MQTKQIKITSVIATSGRYNRIQLDVLEDDGNGGTKWIPVRYPQGRRGEDDDSLAVESSVFAMATSIYYSTTDPDKRVGRAQLYVDNRCCCGCSKLPVDGIYSLEPLAPPKKGS